MCDLDSEIFILCRCNLITSDSCKVKCFKIHNMKGIANRILIIQDYFLNIYIHICYTSYYEDKGVITCRFYCVLQEVTEYTKYNAGKTNLLDRN